jgi:aminopeptidase N
MRDGMEYPMLTLDSDEEPDYRSLFMHEIGHNWFFGMVGNNETYRAMLDEGFTQFITAWGLEHVDGDTLMVDEPNNYVFSYTEPVLARENKVYNSYMRAAVRDELPPIDTHSDEFGHVPSGYRMVYYKTATMLYNLQYVLGDELFTNALRTTSPSGSSSTPTWRTSGKASPTSPRRTSTGSSTNGSTPANASTTP